MQKIITELNGAVSEEEKKVTITKIVIKLIGIGRQSYGIGKQLHKHGKDPKFTSDEPSISDGQTIRESSSKNNPKAS